MSSSNQVDVKMEDALPGARTDIYHRAVSFFDATFACDLGSHQVAIADSFGVFRPGFF